MASELLDDEGVRTGLSSLDDSWAGSTAELRCSIEFADFLTAVEFVRRLAPVCEAIDHHPDLTISWRTVGIVLSTHSAGGVTARDVQLARQLDAIAADLPLAEA